MEHEEERKREEREAREKVLVPVRRHEAVKEEEIAEEPTEKTWKMPRRWHLY